MYLSVNPSLSACPYHSLAQYIRYKIAIPLKIVVPLKIDTSTMFTQSHSCEIFKSWNGDLSTPMSKTKNSSEARQERNKALN